MRADPQSGQVECFWQRLYGSDSRQPWLLTITIRPSLHGHAGAWPQASAVQDDFGNLHIVAQDDQRGAWA